MDDLKLEIYQWLVPLIALIFIVRTIRQYSRHRRSIRGTALWISFWVAIALLAIVPNWISGRLAVMLGFKSNINAVIFLALGGLYIFVFYLSASITRLETQFTDLVRELAKQQERERKREDRREQV